MGDVQPKYLNTADTPAFNKRFNVFAANLLRKARSLTVTVLGVMIAFALTIPLVNIAVPVLAVATFTHLYHLLSGSAGRAA